MSDEHPEDAGPTQPNQVETFRVVAEDDYSEDDGGEEEESSEESNGCLQASYSIGDINEELIKNGGTLGRSVQDLPEAGQAVMEPIYENLRFGDGVVYSFRTGTGGCLSVDLDRWSSSEFDDTEEEVEPGDPLPASGAKSFDFFMRQKKKVSPKLTSINPETTDRLRMSSRTRAMWDGFKKNVNQSIMLPKIGGRKPRPEEVQEEPDRDLEPLNFGVGSKEFSPARLPEPAPEGLTDVQRKRRQIVSQVVESEKNYLLALKKLIEEYQLPLMKAQPPIISQKHVRVIFDKVRDIIQCHLLFHGELHGVVGSWDEVEKIGDVFTASFSKSTVFEAYSSFVNNFSTAMDRAKKQARLKSAFNAFLKEKLDNSKDKLSLFGLMVKPVQRFPQFILLIQDLLKHTPQDHPDRLSLQLALTELEMLTDRLNETKKECESIMEARRLAKVLNLGALGSRQDAESLFIRQDDVIQHKSKDGGTENKLKRLFLLSTHLVCTTINKQKESADPSTPLLIGEKLIVSWSANIKDIEVVDPTLPSFKNHPLSRPSFSSTTTSKKQGRSIPSPAATPSWNPYWKDVDDMLHDIKVLEEMCDRHASLRLQYKALPIEILKDQIASLEVLIRQKIDIDKNIVMLSIPTNRGKKTVTLEFPSLTMKHDWLIELQSAKLATDPINFPAWFLSENDPLSSRNPRFMTALKLEVITKEDKKMTLKPKKKSKDELHCCTYITLPCHNKPGSGIRHLWVCMGGKAAIVSLHTNQPFVVEGFNITDGSIVAAECIIEPSLTFDPEQEGVARGNQGEREVVWMVSDDNKIYMIPAIQKERQLKDRPVKVDGAQVRCMKYLNGRVYLGTSDGTLVVYSRSEKGEWNFPSPQKISLGNGEVTFLLVSDDDTLWASCTSTVHVLGTSVDSVVNVKTSHVLANEDMTLGKRSGVTIECMVKAGVGLLVSFTNQSTIRLFHAETFQHLQDINISSAISNLIEEKASGQKLDLSPSLSITCMLPSKGILYVGTNQGFVLTLPLPRLNGMPKFRQRPAISYQGHVGPVRFLASINCSLIDGSHDARQRGIEGADNQGKSCHNSSDTLIGEECSDTSPQEELKTSSPKWNGGGEVSAPSLMLTSLSSSSPDLTKNLNSMKCKQMEGLYESLLRGVLENEDDSAVLERIASTPLPHRRHRIQKMFKVAFLQEKEPTISEQSTPNHQGEVELRSSENRKRNIKLRHSASELLEPSVISDECSTPQHPPKDEGKEQSSLNIHEEGKGQAVDEPSKTNGLDDTSTPSIGLCSSDAAPSGGQPCNEVDSKPYHLNKSVSSISDTPSQKSTSSGSSTTRHAPESASTGNKFSALPRLFSIPSSAAMISSTLTTTPKSRAIVFVSAGRGYIPWNSPSRVDASPDKPYLLLWMC